MPINDTRSYSVGGVSSLIVFGWFLVFVGFEWLRYKFGQHTVVGLSDLPNLISILEIIQIAMILRLVDRRRIDAPFYLLDASFALGTVALCILVLHREPLLAALILSAFTMWRFKKHTSCRLSSLAQFAFIGQFVLLGWPFLVLHNLVGWLDAIVVRAVLRVIGQDVGGYGTYIIHTSRNAGFDVMWGCATSTTLVQNIVAFGIIAGGIRGYLQRSDIGCFFFVIVGTFALNWLRLVLICSTKDGYLFWHEGQGAALLATAYAIFIIALAYRVTRPAPA